MSTERPEPPPASDEAPPASKAPQRKPLTDRMSLLTFGGSVLLLVFGIGMWIGGHRRFPYSVFLRAYAEYDALKQAKKPHNLTPVFYRFAGARIVDAAKMAPGVTLVTSSWLGPNGYKPAIRLLDAHGKVLHEWPTDPAAIWPESPYHDHVAGTKNKSDNYVHGSYLFDNGDVIFNVEYLTVARMNAKGKILWKLPIRAHHSVERDADGNFWVCSMDWIEETPDGARRLKAFPGLKAPVVEDYAVKISGDGKILKSISVTKALYDAGEQSLFWRTGGRVTDDILHTNDVQPLLPELAPTYPSFAAGDLMVSARTVHTVMLIDHETGRLKWTTSGFVKQHDVDFIGDGWIRVFDNRNDGTETGDILGPTRLVGVDTGSQARRRIYPPDLSQPFYTQWGGKVQDLPNGNLLITEARRGHVLEVDPTGRTVWEWVHEATDDGMVPEVLEGTRYALTPEQIAAWK